jgi:hypothetical protein
VSPVFGRRVAASAVEVEADVQANQPYVTAISFGVKPINAVLQQASGEWRIAVSHEQGRDTLVVEPPRWSAPDSVTVKEVDCMRCSG